MPYPTLPGRKFNYDVGGGSVYWSFGSTGALTLLTTEQMTKLNSENNSSAAISKVASYSEGSLFTLYLFLPEKLTVTGLYSSHSLSSYYSVSYAIEVHGSADSTNGLDGTWIAANMPNGMLPRVLMDDDGWRSKIQPCTFSEQVRVIRIRYNQGYSSGTQYTLAFYALHVYGNKGTGETPNDILFMDDDASNDPEFARDLDFGDRPEGTTTTHRIKLYNQSTTKTSNNLSLVLSDADHTFSMDEGTTWVTGATIASLAPQTASSSIIIKNTVPPPTQLLGPRMARVEVRVGSWS